MSSTTRNTYMVHTEEGLTFIWAGGHHPVTVMFGDTEIGAINMSQESREYDLSTVIGTFEEHVKLFEQICSVFVTNHLSGAKA